MQIFPVDMTHIYSLICLLYIYALFYESFHGFLANFIADIGSYSQLIIVSFFPIHRKKSQVKVTKLKKK